MTSIKFLSLEDQISHLESTYKGGIDKLLRDYKSFKNESKGGNVLPQDILVEISQYCQKPTILNLLLVSKYWSAMLLSSSLLWQRLLKIYWKIEQKTTDSDELVREYVIKRINAEISSEKIKDKKNNFSMASYEGRLEFFSPDIMKVKDYFFHKQPRYNREKASRIKYDSMSVHLDNNFGETRVFYEEVKFFVWDEQTINHTKVRCVFSLFTDHCNLAHSSIEMDLDDTPFLYIKQKTTEFSNKELNPYSSTLGPKKDWFFPVDGNKFDEICEKFGILRNTPKDIDELLKIGNQDILMILKYTTPENLEEMKIFLVFLKFLFEDGSLGFYNVFTNIYHSLGIRGIVFNVLYSRK